RSVLESQGRPKYERPCDGAKESPAPLAGSEKRTQRHCNRGDSKEDGEPTRGPDGSKRNIGQFYTPGGVSLLHRGDKSKALSRRSNRLFLSQEAELQQSDNGDRSRGQAKDSGQEMTNPSL